MTLLRGLKKCLVVHIRQGGKNGIFQSWTYYVHDWMPWDQLHSPLVCLSASRLFALPNHDAWGKFNLNHKFPNHVKLLCILCKNLIQSILQVSTETVIVRLDFCHLRSEQSSFEWVSQTTDNPHYPLSDQEANVHSQF